MQRLHQPQRQRQLLEPRYALLQGDHVIAHFVEVIRYALDERSCLDREQLTERRLGAFDLARQNSFTLYEGPDQDMWIEKPSSFTCQSSN